MRYSRSHLVFAFLFAFFLLSRFSHGQMMLEAANQGHISIGPYSMSHSSTDMSYQLGPDQWSPFYAVPYFMFNVPTLSAPLESVKFSVYNPGDVTYEDFDGLLRDQGVVSNGDSPFEVKLWDYTGDPSLFISDFYTYFGPGSPDDTPWGDDLDDLRSGTQYGSRMMDSSLDGQWVDFYLTGDALTDIMAAQGGEFTFGMWQEDFNTAFYGEDVFSQQAGYEGQSHPLARLEFQFQNAIGSAIPEPSTYGLIATLVLGLTIVGRKIRRKA